MAPRGTHHVEVPDADRRSLVSELSRPLWQAAGWMKFLAILMLIGAVLDCFKSWWALAVMWFPIWSALLLSSSARAAVVAYHSGDEQALRTALARIRTYFKLTGMVTLILILVAAGVIIYRAAIQQG
jgi:hypothetical protein